MSPKITTIIPTYNRLAFLKKAIESALEQTFKDIEILILDNCSQDGTEDYVRGLMKIDNRISYFRNKENIGSSANIRLGIEKVNTEFFSVLCDDNYLELDFYEKALKLFVEYSDCGFVVFNTDICDINYKLIKKSMPFKNKIEHNVKKYYALPIGFNAILNNEIPMEWTGYVFRKSAFPDIDFGEFSEFGHGQDIFLIWRFASRFPFVLYNIKAATYVTHQNSVSGTIVKIFDERFLYWWRNRMLIILEDPKVSLIIKKYLREYYFNNSTKSLKSFKYYTHAAIVLMIDRFKNKEYKEFELDFIALRSFLPMLFLIFLSSCVRLLVTLKIDERIREIIRKLRTIK